MRRTIRPRGSFASCRGIVGVVLVGVVLVVVPGCGGPRDEAVSLIEPSSFEPADEAGPFSDLPAADCSEGYAFEPPVFEVNTDSCNPGVFRQPLLSEVRAGESVRLVIYHLSLEGETDTEVTLHLALGDTVVGSLTEPVPSEERVLRPRFGMVDTVAEGDWLWFRLANHGANSWQFLEAQAGSEAALDALGEL